MCAEALTTAWTKYYCQYRKEGRTLTMVAYNQTVGKGTSGVSSYIHCFQIWNLIHHGCLLYQFIEKLYYFHMTAVCISCIVLLVVLEQ